MLDRIEDQHLKFSIGDANLSCYNKADNDTALQSQGSLLDSVTG